LSTIFVFGSAAHWWELPQWLGFALDADTQALVVVILVFAIMIWFITKEDKPADANKPNFFSELGKVMGGGKKP